MAFREALNRANGDKGAQDVEGATNIDDEKAKHATLTEGKKDLRQKEAMGEIFTYNMEANPEFKSIREIRDKFEKIELKKDNEGWFT